MSLIHVTDIGPRDVCPRSLTATTCDQTGHSEAAWRLKLRQARNFGDQRLGSSRSLHVTPQRSALWIVSTLPLWISTTGPMGPTAADTTQQRTQVDSMLNASELLQHRPCVSRDRQLVPVGGMREQHRVETSPEQRPHSAGGGMAHAGPWSVRSVMSRKAVSMVAIRMVQVSAAPPHHPSGISSLLASALPLCRAAGRSDGMPPPSLRVLWPDGVPRRRCRESRHWSAAERPCGGMHREAVRLRGS